MGAQKAKKPVSIEMVREGLHLALAEQRVSEQVRSVNLGLALFVRLGAFLLVDARFDVGEAVNGDGFLGTRA